MYALVNVEKFVQDNADRLGDRAEGILARAKEHAGGTGVISGGAVKDIMGDDDLTHEFSQTVTDDPEHMRIGLEAINKA
ncbi:hypothetical protein A3H10_00135 [Candidatus Uhrbacteria bacterium RIFCSPLOWO2_12_FULL_46_10]|uniref:Uncharacterized protein n=1 Tax=Candidatus Uhrbacteria bacterium RIFCSPLOWO2_01_FULL_47_25 TaxID=1802402 RepID=A0A1F7URI7_9BACT|nr:MAG: hypothetical protein A2752_04100 [Candidatus Uhrbacteria bacterium RIFCSPHIGHO2_01_FULL_46_23]OGL69445.1 MAG: hypothetical protein A3D60_03170 [Candidatus Uhrbacteria bacterium RIFCSPHIGHO2_02_FULL_47_29]OGL75357.1 MAG: hypothetical protein A3E96_02490 [Candidatus Uhrbacteria bacterium RIFCSPHIGHO2_12_FULL_46_13]OGL80901.1 MAG: hypothetical protein A2936_05735 [Candidatus Uhrbacteria bacterium RIFCSPLOWO2_01_FULL_47_25]OGL84735.1 MAG: hypothetical protein A3I37_01235 [Candidatus Uhrbact